VRTKKEHGKEREQAERAAFSLPKIIRKEKKSVK
jgi:hypothetical protein